MLMMMLLVMMMITMGPACARDTPTLILPDLTSLPVFVIFVLWWYRWSSDMFHKNFMHDLCGSWGFDHQTEEEKSARPRSTHSKTSLSLFNWSLFWEKISVFGMGSMGTSWLFLFSLVIIASWSTLFIHEILWNISLMINVYSWSCMKMVIITMNYYWS